MLLLCVVFIFPFLNVIAKSVSSEAAVLSGKVKFLPIKPHLNAYKYVLFSSRFYISLKNSVVVTIIGTVFSIILLCFTAYPLSKKNLAGRKFITKLYVFTMIFSAVLIPDFYW